MRAAGGLSLANVLGVTDRHKIHVDAGLAQTHHMTRNDAALR